MACADRGGGSCRGGRLRELAAGRTDLLAEVAGVVTGFYAGELEEPKARTAAQLCIAAGADPEAIEGWVAVGRERRENARRPPFSGGLRSLRFSRRPGDDSDELLFWQRPPAAGSGWWRAAESCRNGIFGPAECSGLVAALFEPG